MSLTSLAGLKRMLAPLAKRALDEVAAHPMLSTPEIALSLQISERGLQTMLKELRGFKLIQAASQERDERFVLTQLGIAYLAAAQGFGRAVKGYALARGWKHGTTSMANYWEHTKSENRFFLQLAQAAKAHGARVTWRSELECRLYYEARGRRESFLPDGDAVYQGDWGQVRLALEIDRSRASIRKLRRKFNQYLASWQSRVFGALSDRDFRLLVVTTSWQRAKVLRRLVLELARPFRTTLPILITTFEMLERPGLDRPIWHRVDTWERCYCIESWQNHAA